MNTVAYLMPFDHAFLNQNFIQFFTAMKTSEKSPRNPIIINKLPSIIKKISVGFMNSFLRKLINSTIRFYMAGSIPFKASFLIKVNYIQLCYISLFFPTLDHKSIQIYVLLSLSYLYVFVYNSCKICKCHSVALLT